MLASAKKTDELGAVFDVQAAFQDLDAVLSYLPEFVAMMEFKL